MRPSPPLAQKGLVLPTPREALEILRRSQADPQWWAKTVLGIDLHDVQAEALCSWRDNRRTSHRSCNGIGKTVEGAVGVLWLGSCWADTLVLTTATTFTQVRGTVWREIGQLAANATRPLGCEVMQTEIRWAHGSTAIGITAPATDATKMQGYRGRKRTFILGDEAGGLSAAILEGINSMLTGQDAHLLLTGNPTDPSSEFKRTFDRPGVVKVKTSAFDTPNFRAYGITIDDIRASAWRAKVTGPYPFPALITPEWVQDLYEQVGRNEEDPRWVARVLAEFPATNASGLVPPHWYEAAVRLGQMTKAQRAEMEQVTGPWIESPIEVGCDVARSLNGDASVIGRRRGVFFRTARIVHGADAYALTADLGRVMRPTPERSPQWAEVAKVDEGGNGSGVVDVSRAEGLPIDGVMFGASARDSEHFANLRAEGFWALRERYEATYRASRGEPVAPGVVLEEPDEYLAEELAAIRWFETPRGQIAIEPKEQTKARLSGGRSPDRADAQMLTFLATGSPRLALPNIDTNWVGPQWNV